MTAQTERNEILVGTFVILGFIFLTLVVFFVSGVYLFRPGYKVDVMYEYVSSLDKGAPVRMAGVRVGEVDKVNLIYDENTQQTRVRVKLFIEKGVEIRENYVFKIQGTHILSEPHIEISPESGDEPLLREGAVIEGANPVPVERLVKKADQIAGELTEILVTIRTTIQDPEITEPLREVIRNMAKLSESLDSFLITSESDFKKLITNLNVTTESLNNILVGLDEGQGTLGKLFKEDDLYEDLRDFVAEIKAHPWRLLKRK